MFGSLLKAAVGVAIDLPVSIVSDTVTLGGTLGDGESAIGKSLETIGDNLEKAVNPDTDILD